MGQLVYVLGKSGTGKSYSLRNFPKDKIAVVNVQGKILPFKGAGQIEQTAVDTSDKIIKCLTEYAKHYKTIVIDDYQYTMANEFMRRSYEKGYDKFTEIGRHAWDIANTVTTLPQDVIVYILCHIDRDDEGNEKIKTIGKLLDEKICLEGMSTIVLKTNVSDGVYSFVTQNNGRDTTKSPAGMFPTYAIENDLWYVDQKIRNYYELGEHLPDETIERMDEEAKQDDVKPDANTSRRKKSDEPAKRERKPREEVARPEVDLNTPYQIEEGGSDLSESTSPIDQPIKHRRRRAADVEVAKEESPTEGAPKRRRRRE